MTNSSECQHQIGHSMIVMDQDKNRTTLSSCVNTDKNNGIVQTTPNEQISSIFTNMTDYSPLLIIVLVSLHSSCHLAKIFQIVNHKITSTSLQNLIKGKSLLPWPPLSLYASPSPIIFLTSSQRHTSVLPYYMPSLLLQQDDQFNFLNLQASRQWQSHVAFMKTVMT